MPVITSIKQQKNKRSLAGYAGKNRVNVYLDDKFGFGIDLENFVILGLKVNQELSEKEVEDIVRKAEFQKTLDKLLRFATFRPRSEKEVNDYFRRKKVHDSLYPDLLKKLKHFNLINDEEFAKWWVKQRLLKKKSLRSMIYELRFKGVKKEIIDQVLGEEKVDEEKMARDLLEKKSYKWKNLPPREAKLKMSQYLAGKGFGWEVIEKIVRK